MAKLGRKEKNKISNSPLSPHFGNDRKLIPGRVEGLAGNICQELIDLEAAFGEFTAQALLIIMLQPVKYLAGAVCLDDRVFVQAYFFVLIFESV